jgi:putative transcriptional regulator
MAETTTRANLLVAAPSLVDPNFARTVVLLCDYNEEGALGIVVNRRTDVPIEDVLRQMEVPDGAIVGPVLWGGPVQPGAVFLTFPGDAPQEGGAAPVFHLGTGVHVSPAREIIETVAADASRGGAFITLGYAGWAPGQLDGEIKSGSWLVLDVDPDLVFRVPVERRYDFAIESLGVAPSLLWMSPVDE